MTKDKFDAGDPRDPKGPQYSGDWRDKRKPFTAKEIADGVPDQDTRFKRDPLAPPFVGVDLGDPAGDMTANVLVGNVTQWNGAWTIIGEVPAEAGKLMGSTVFRGMLILAFEHGLWCVEGGKLRKVTIDNA